MNYKEITTWELVCKEAAISPELPNFSALPLGLEKYMTACYMRAIITRVINGCDQKGKIWKPDYSNRQEAKYELWVWPDTGKQYPSGFGFANTLFDYSYTHTCSGARLVFQSVEKKKHALKYFEQVFINHLHYIE